MKCTWSSPAWWRVFCNCQAPTIVCEGWIIFLSDFVIVAFNIRAQQRWRHTQWKGWSWCGDIHPRTKEIRENERPQQWLPLHVHTSRAAFIRTDSLRSGGWGRLVQNLFDVHEAFSWVQWSYLDVMDFIDTLGLNLHAGEQNASFFSYLTSYFLLFIYFWEKW